jgi:beta-lactamase superfamily II metal-dependent hydrolase
MGLMLKLKPAPFIFILSAFLLGISFSWLPVWMVIPLYIISLLLFAFWWRNVNNASIVMKLFYGSTSYLFTGDLEMEGEAQIIQFNEALKSDVLKVAHHGSKTSSSDYFLQKVLPKIAVVSVGYKNKFRHPNKDVMNRISQYAETIHRTDQSGALWLQSDGSKIWEVHWK